MFFIKTSTLRGTMPTPCSFFVFMASVCLIIYAADASCFLSHGCKDTALKIERTDGESWRSGDCYNCVCWEEQTILKVCFKADKTNVAENVKKSVRDIHENPDWKDLPEVIVLSHGNSSAITCPPLPLSYYESKSDTFVTPLLKEIHYVTMTKMMSCCRAFWTPTNIDGRCHRVWRKDECIYEVLLKGTNDHCPYPYSAVGK